VGLLRPAIKLKMVLFPQPEGPTKLKNSPSWIVRDTSCRATVPVEKALVTLLREMAGCKVDRAGGRVELTGQALKNKLQRC
jgi:hypothetical protein